MADDPGLELFVSYSHHDEPWRDALFGRPGGGAFVATSLGDCRVWSDTWLRAGDRWQDEIERRLARCAMAALLVTPNFLKSAFIRERELPPILRRHTDRELALLWCPIGVDEDELSRQRPELAKLQAAWSLSEVPAQGWTLPQVGVEVARGLRERIEHQVRLAADPEGEELARVLTPRYELGRRHRTGSRASIYRARDKSLGRDVAVKVLRAEDGDDAAGAAARREEFIADVCGAVRLSDEPNFISVYDRSSAQTPRPYCVQQWVQGHTLRERLDALRPERPLPVERLRRVFTRLAHSLARAHAAGVTYGNIMPSNVILSGTDEPFLLPMGRSGGGARRDARLAPLVQRLEAAGGEAGMLSPADCEDLAYLVPEHFGTEVDDVEPELSDQYMLGLLGWEMLTLQRPKTVPQPGRLSDLTRSDFVDVPRVRTLRPLAPQRVDDLIARMTARRPRERFARMQDVVDALEAMPDIGLLVVADSWRRVMAGEARQRAFFTTFYERFLQRAPGAAAFFERAGPFDWPRQHAMLKEAVLLLLAFHQQGDGEAQPNVLSRVAHVHRHHAIPPELFDEFADALVDCICGHPAQGLAPADPLCADPRHRDALDEHWRRALEPGVRWLASRPPS